MKYKPDAQAREPVRVAESGDSAMKMAVRMGRDTHSLAHRVCIALGDSLALAFGFY